MDARWKPMLCKEADVMPDDTDSWVLEPKYDGWRAVTVIEPTGVTVYGGRNGNKYTGQVPYIENALRGALPANTVIDGELMHPAGWGSVQSAMTTKGGGPGITLVAFDVLQINGSDVRDLPWENRRELLEMIEWPAHTHLTPTGVATAETHVRMLDLGMEGSVVKRRESAYQSGRRATTWLKLKAIASEDCEIVNFKPGENGRAGEVGAIVVRLPSGVETTASGMTDKVRADMLANPQDYLGKIVEITHNGVMDSGKLRHPRFKRMRDDRSPAPVVKPKSPSTGSRGPSKRMRNYKAMGDDKLMGCVRELAGCYGEAYQRANSDSNYSVREHFIAAQEVAVARGFTVPAFSRA